jgi:hypothetical protein
MAQVKSLLQLRCLARSLRAEEHHRRVGRHHGAGLRAEQVAWILGRENECALILANPAREADHEAPDRRILEEKPELVDDEHPPPVSALDSGP